MALLALNWGCHNFAYTKFGTKWIMNIERGTLNTTFFDIFTMNKAAKKMNMLL